MSAVILRLVLAALVLVFVETAAKKEHGDGSPEEKRRDYDVKIAAILPRLTEDGQDWMFATERVSPAIDIALETVNARMQSADGHLRLTVAYSDDKCDSAEAMNHAINDYVKGDVDVFFGPCCDYAVAPVARQTRFWNLPIMTAGAMARDFATHRPTFYPMLTRVGANLNSLAKFIAVILREHGWKKVKLVYDPDGHGEIVERFCHLATDGIHQALLNINERFRENETNEDVKHGYFKIVKEQPFNEEQLREEIGRNYAIVVLCASPDSVREIMIKAHELNFDNGEYVFFNIDLFSSQAKIEKSWYRENDDDKRNEKARRAYEALMTVTLRKPDSDDYKRFSDEVKRRARVQYADKTVYGEEEVNSFVGAFHDAVILYALALNETLEAGHDPSNGTEITSRMWNRTFQGITGNVSIDENGDRNADYSLLNLNPSTQLFQVVANYYGSRKQYEPVPEKHIYWAGRVDMAPGDTPKCGFDGTGCPEPEPIPAYIYVIIILGSLLVIVSLAAFLIHKQQADKAGIAESNWRVRWDDILFGAPETPKLKRIGSRTSLMKRSSFGSNLSLDSIYQNNACSKQIFTVTGFYRGALVAIKRTNKSFNITRPILFEFKAMRNLQNDHIVRFVGVCIDPGNNCIITEYCQRGSLQDVLENDQIKLDNMFKFSLIQDVVRGMDYIHGSEIKSHGNLKSSNCVVDSRFVLKLTDFGLHGLKGRDDLSDLDDYAYYRAKFWTAPELLRLHNPPPEGTQRGDVYSFAIICQEILYRNGAFWLENEEMSSQEIYRRVKDGKRPYFRPKLVDQVQGESYNEDLLNVIRKCWSEEPNERQDFHALKSTIKRINKGGEGGGNLLDNLLVRMGQYAENLEELVAARTADYLTQKKRAEDLLYRMLPVSVAQQLMEGRKVEAVEFKSVTIYFSDICGFTKLSAESTPMQVVDLLNDLYTTFDTILETLDVYKVETIGDAYMVVSGLPIVNGTNHAREISRMALRLLNAVQSFKIRHKPTEQLKLRIGIHSGVVYAGIVGKKMPRYCLFGDTVNTASRMESNGEALRIHVSPETKEILDTFGNFVLELRGPVDMKGKGEIVTWWLIGETSSDYPDLLPHDGYT